MNKTELAAIIAEKAELTKKDAEAVLNAIMDSVKAVSYTHLITFVCKLAVGRRRLEWAKEIYLLILHRYVF